MTTMHLTATIALPRTTTLRELRDQLDAAAGTVDPDETTVTVHVTPGDRPWESDAASLKLAGPATRSTT